MGIAVGLVGFGGIFRVAEVNMALSETMTIPLGQLLIITEDFQKTQLFLRNFADAGADTREKARSKITELETTASVLTQKLESRIVTPRER